MCLWRAGRRAAMHAPGMAERSVRRRRVVFVGNCQARALARLYELYIAPDQDERAEYVSLGPWMRDAERDQGLARLRGANVVVEQFFEAAPWLPRDRFDSAVRWVGFPMMTGIFLWPYASNAHPRNRSHRFLPAGPYPVELGDAMLNRLMQDGVPTDEAVERYLEHDIVRATHLDRMMELHFERQQQRDVATGIDTHDFILSRFRSEPLFLTRGHPTPALFCHLARQVFDRLEVPYSLYERGLRYSATVGFPRDELPIHTAVAAHLRLAYVMPEQGYRFYHEGSFTLRQFVRRYLDYDWEPDLAEGIRLARSGEQARPLTLLESALRRCPGSAWGWTYYGLTLARLKRFEEAEAAVARGLALDPDDPELHCVQVRVKLLQNRVDEAETVARAAIDRAPHLPLVHLELAEVLTRRGRPAAAARVAVLAASLAPGDEQAARVSARYLTAAGDVARAEAALRRAQEAEELDASVEDPAAAAMADPQDAALNTGLGEWLLRQGELLQAEAAFRRAIARDAGHMPARLGLADALERQGARREAVAVLREATAIEPGEAGTADRLGRLLARDGDLAAAATAYRAAIDAGAREPGLLTGLADVLDRQGRLGEAIAVLREAVGAGMADAAIYTRLDNLLFRAGDVTGAQAAHRRALELRRTARKPATSPASSGLAVLRAAVAAGLADARLQGQLGEALLRQGDLDTAEVAYRRAAQLDPDHPAWQRALEEVARRRRAELSRSA